MRFSVLAVFAVLTPVSAFLPSASTKSSFGVVSKKSDEWTKLNMAFKTDLPSNMFDGPAPLVKERDACGVGFIANTNSGGTYVCRITAITEDKQRAHLRVFDLTNTTISHNRIRKPQSSIGRASRTRLYGTPRCLRR